jgi:hypothetical protein
VNAPVADARGRGRRLWLARAIWLAVASPSVAMLALLVPIHLRTIYYEWQFLDSYAVVAPFLSRGGYAAYVLAAQYLVAGLCLVTAAFIAWQKADERVAWLSASMLVMLPLSFGLGGSSDTWVYYPEAWRPSLQVWHSLVTVVGGVAGLTAFVFLFPDGRFAPRWAGLVFGAVSAFLAFSSVWLALGHELIFELWLAVFLVALIFGAGAQLYRYRRLASPVERQQIKWVVASLMLWVTSLPLFILLTTIGEGASFRPLVLFIANHTQWATVGLLPLSLAFSIFRYRLWDIDPLIRRTLVYSVLTAALGLLYVGSVLALQQLANPLLGAGSSQPAVIGSTLLIAAVARPLNRRVQRAIDRRFYRRHYDADLTLAAFSAGLRNDVELERLTARLLAVVDESVQPAHASLWIRPARKP